MISELELEWETVLQAEDEDTGIVLLVRPDDAGGWCWEAYDDQGDTLDRDIGFSSALEAQASAVTWWKEWSEGAGRRA